MASSKPDRTLDEMKARIAVAELGPASEETGTIMAVADGLVTISGLPGAGLNEVIALPGGESAFVLTLGQSRLHAALLDPAPDIKAGDRVGRTGTVISVPVGDPLLGRVIDPLGRPLDEHPPPETDMVLPAERPAPDIIDRDFVSQPLETGLLVVDALFAIGRGQRELIIGERKTGKTSIAVATMINQTDSDVICVYVAIGQRMSDIRRTIRTVQEHGIMERTIFVIADATSEPGLRWLAPFSATSIAEWFRDRGRDVLIVYDDLTKHAATHRELALLSRQPPGREAYPGDIFYLHARLLERSARLSAEKGGGSMTALPIAEIEAGNLSAYIPTNLISIADGQIVTSATLFASNQRPAIDVGLSVSRVGGKAQSDAMKSVAGRLRLDYAQYLEMKMFSRFGGFGEAGMRERMVRGERIAALLAQDRYAPLPSDVQIALLAALGEGMLDPVDPGRLRAVKAALPGILSATPEVSPREPGAFKLDQATRKRLLDAVRTALSTP